MGMSLRGCEKRGKTVGAAKRTVEAREDGGTRKRTLRGQGGGVRHGVDEIGCGELRREPHERARQGGSPPDMPAEGLGSQGGGGRAERNGRDEGGGSKDGKTSTEYARGLRESGSVGEAEVIFLEFWIRNGFRVRLVTGLKESRYHGKKARWRAYQGEAGRRDRPATRRPQKGSMGIGALGAKG